MRPLAVALVVTSVGLIVAQGQSSSDARLQAQLKRLFPVAAAFSPREGMPPHFKAFAKSQTGAETVLGYAFWTTDLQPLERAYDGPIRMLVGLDVRGFLTGVIVVEHHEPYGDFSVDRPEFARQFERKDIRDPFKVGGDIDAVSRATITITSATRTIRNSARRIARQFLPPPGAQP